MQTHSAPYALSTEAPPVSLLAPPERLVTRPEKSLPVRAELATAGGGTVRSKGFARAWTRDAVLVQVLWPKEYYTAPVEVWLEPARVARRVIEPAWPGRGG